MKQRTDDLTGQVFGWLTVTGRDITRPRYWNCICDCGNEKSVRKDHLMDGSTHSCGCYRRLSKIKDIPIGSKWGRLTVIRRIDLTATWECLCDCGNTCIVKGKDLRREHTRSCGCLAQETSAKNGSSLKINMIGQRFGRLVVLEEIPYEQRSEKDQPAWLCQCDCGNTYIASGYHLRRGDINSCGCIKRIDITGNKYGKLTAIARDDEFSKNHKFKHSYWHCKCECGNDVTIYLGHLQNGHTTSCGCDKSSKGEKEITQILEENNINFIHDKQYFKDLILPSGGIGRYDYIIFNEDNSIKCIIEFDGEQHYRDGWNSLENVRLNDEAKNKYAFSNHIPIIRIPYWEKGNITLSLLFDGTYELSPDMEEADGLDESNVGEV